VLGENHVAAGFETVQAMVTAMVEGEPAQLAAMIDFIKANHLDDELRAHNWPALARGYNGPNYAKFGYDTKLAAAFAKWAAIRDTPYAPPTSTTLPMALNATPAKPVLVVIAPAPPSVGSPIPVAPPRHMDTIMASAAPAGRWQAFVASFKSVFNHGSAA
jgi:hypothetical protein